MIACTIIARNYLAQARVLERSFVEHNPGHRFVTLIIDAEPEDRAGAGLGEVLLPGDLGLPERDVQDMAAIYDVMEFATALKAALLMRLLADGGPVAYLDPDIVVFAPMTEAFDLAERSGIALTPHVLQPMPRDGRETSERTIMHAGMFNLGFIAVGAAGWPFLRWWHERLLRDAVVDLDNALFTDQRWVDWVPALFEHSVIRDCGYNVAYWNLHERPLRRAPDGAPTTGGRPLRFLHFSGWDSERPWLLSKHSGTTGRADFTGDSILRQLCDDYGTALAAAGHARSRQVPYRLATSRNGERLTGAIRRYLRAVWSTADAAGRAPNPFADPDAFSAWLSESVTTDGLPYVSRLGMALWSARRDVRAAFPDPATRDAPAVAAWLDADPWAVEQAEQVLGGASRRSGGRTEPPAPRRFGAGWNLLAYANAELGVGEAGRRLAWAVMHVGVPAQVVGVPVEKSRQNHVPAHRLATGLTYPNTITCVNADEMQRIWQRARVGGRSEGRQVGLWFWEVDRVPETVKSTMGLLDEVWVTSQFTKKALDVVGGCPVRVIPLPVPLTAPTAMTRTMLGLPEDKTVFLYPYDFLSVLRRKNPQDVIAAYTAAFGPDDGTTLVLKSINGHHAHAELHQVRYWAEGRPDIVVRDGYLDAGRMRALIELSDCVVSLHRSEGYGLNLIDAMALGTPVIATGYSGNLAYMDDDTAFLVPYEEVPVGDGAWPYDPAAVWAQPDVGAAAKLLRTINDEPERVAAVARAARRRAQCELGVDAAAHFLRPLLVDSVRSQP